jgi:TM2 domain-containing membrane protein YozV
MTESQEYSLRWRGRQFGPCTIQEINRKLDEHEIGMGHEVHYENKWISVEEFLLALRSAGAGSTTAKRLPSAQPATGLDQSEPSFIASAAAPVPPPRRSALPTKPSVRTEATTPMVDAAADSHLREARPRHRLIYAMLGILLGFSGVHNFYARHWLTGLFQLLLSLATLVLGFGIIATWIWALVEAVLIRKDGYEIEMC